VLGLRRRTVLPSVLGVEHVVQCSCRRQHESSCRAAPADDISIAIM